MNRREIVRAILSNDVAKVSAAFQSGFDPLSTTDAEQWNLLHHATLLVGRPIPIDTLEYLLATCIPINAQDCYGNAPIYYAVRNKDDSAVAVLLEHGANPNLDNSDGVSPLQIAIYGNPFTPGIPELLLAYGANPDHPGVKALAAATNNQAVSVLLAGARLGTRPNNSVKP